MMLKAMDYSVIDNPVVPGEERHAEIYAVTSGKGGVGKSSLSVNMGILLGQLNKKVLLVDADLHLGNVDLILGTRVRQTIFDVVKNKMDPRHAVIHGPANLDILPASSGSLEMQKMEDQVLRQLAEAFTLFNHTYDIILLDTGAGIAKTVISFLLGADKIVLVMTPDPSSIADAYAVIKIVKSVNPAIPFVIISNMVASKEEGEVLYQKMNLMARKFLNSQLEYGASVIKDDLIAWSVKNQKPFVLEHPNSSAAASLRILNRTLLRLPAGQDSGDHNLFGRLIRNRKVKLEWNL